MYMLECIRWSAGKPLDTGKQMEGLVTMDDTENSYKAFGMVQGWINWWPFYCTLLAASWCGDSHLSNTHHYPNTCQAVSQSTEHTRLSQLMPIQLIGDDNNLSITWSFPSTVCQVCDVFLSVYWCVPITFNIFSWSHFTSYNAIKAKTSPSMSFDTCPLTVQGYFIKNDWFLWQKYQACSIRRVPKPV